MRVKIFTDGACRGNPGLGGWGVVMCYKDQEIYLRGAEYNTTNNRMELMAAIQALTALKKPCAVDMITDSKYLKDGITTWLCQWKKNEWKTKEKKPVKNQDLWKRLDQEATQHQINWYWVKAHNGHRENEMADQLAKQAIDELCITEKELQDETDRF
jgi:ribonuclease HI